MFTGIVEEIGIIKNITVCGTSGEIYIKAEKVLEGTAIGDSIAVNGICLTVTGIMSDGFTADIMAETVRRTSLKNAANGSPVNLERAMAANGRFGGHIVSGHIDGTGIIRSFVKEENAVWVTISASSDIIGGIVNKGSIAIDGISLTVAELGSDYFKVSVIPHTKDETTLLKKHPGDSVNLENDIVGKYVKRFMEAGSANAECEIGSTSKLTMDMLKDYGY